MADKPAVAVLGTGIMGYPMASRLAGDGFDVRVWNRTTDKARPLGELGATVAETPAAAVAGADAVITMLAGATAVRETIGGSDGVLEALGTGTLWLQMSTVGIEDTDELREMAESAGVRFVDAPVLGTKQPAEQGQLVVLASGPAETHQQCKTILEPLAGRTMWVGDAGAGTRLKLVANTWVLALVEATAECVALAEHLDLDPQLFLDAIRGTGVDSPYAHIKGAAMIQQQFPTSFPARLAAKDARLVLEAGGSGVDLTGTRAVLQHMAEAERLGYGDADMAAVYHACAQDRPEGPDVRS